MTENLITLEQHRWELCKVNAAKASAFKAVADRLTAPAAKARYQSLEKRTGVPWWFIAVVHEREASQNWNSSIAQGDPWNVKSRHVPANRGPFNSWEDAGYDALVNCPPYAARNKDWTPGGALAMLEKYNGMGYFRKGIPSPYIWAGTDQYVKGKYVADGKFDPNAVDQQLGCAGLLKFMGVFKTGSMPSTTTTSTAASALTGGGLLYHYWHLFEAHWIMYSLGLMSAAVVLDLSIHLYKNRKTIKQGTQ